ncbi:type I restriction enzyme EcoKI subunit R [Slackia heliotrinireducens]|uniref:DNA/RNA helicase, superfamily II n=1 Tax=Slackia heliotrinireducens (strain ATCC 29202 / DSM 20476 / NCTC 11029 / RHS 1) TaxID=471855 RepID=C7N5J4_SLAHD|nr:DEAD/DEAH box helicase [Slackia heliotrinireducens]ACV22179.1 DNA/RNA helicase, superfamily II [Slackia heliotrinireducens DSM 20476]VEH00260.1 type I restriction enzyme EcoKI subunit R [Slackia heliotrinireducens]
MHNTAAIINDLHESVETSLFNHRHDSRQDLQLALVINDHKAGEKMLSHVLSELSACDEFEISVAFIRTSGLILLANVLDELEERGVRGRVLTGTYLTFNEPDAFRRLLNYENIETRVYNGSFHAKGYLFKHGELKKLIVGSSNLTDTALTSNQEWNLSVTSAENGKLAKDYQLEFNRLWNHEATSVLTDDWLAEYAEHYDKYRKQAVRSFYYTPQEKMIRPNVMQTEALAGLAQLRDEGKNRALLISATGTGKTYLSAFDVKAFSPKKVLYVVHRNKIARKSMESFQNVLSSKEYSFGMFSGSEKTTDARCIFATVQTLAKRENLEKFAKDEFDYIIVDEVHRAGANSYLRFMDYFEAEFILGMSATPERTDDFDIYELFDHNIAYEIRLNDALEYNLLVPFHYFGVAEVCIDGELLEEDASFNRLVSDERVRHVLNAINKYGYSGERVHGLVFCSRIEEAEELSQKFNNLGYKTVALSGSTSEALRDDAIERLEQDEDDENALDYIFTVDIFNEGIDIPAVNQVVMLRPTQSAIVFVQQLGRGLRTSEGKEYVVVIDFIGNYQKNYLIPIALFGERSGSKEKLRKLISNGSCEIPGSSTVSFDRISTERIIDNINRTNLSKLSMIRDAYKELRAKIGSIPTLQDFLDHGSIDPSIIFENDTVRTYHQFLVRYEKEYNEVFSIDEEKLMELLCREIADGKREAELILIDELLQNRSITINELARKIADNSKSSGTDCELTFESAKMQALSATRVLDLSFFGDSATKKYAPFCSVSNSVISRSPELEKALSNEAFVEETIDVILAAFRIHERDYHKPFNDRPFTLYQRYSRKDACRLACWEHDEHGTIFGYTFKYDDWLVFVTYEKADDISESTKYSDHFETRDVFHWMTRSRVGLDSKEGKMLQEYDPEKTRIHLFVKKEDGEGQDHYYMGTIKPEKIAPTTIKGNKGEDLPILAVEFKMDEQVRRVEYDYIVN